MYKYVLTTHDFIDLTNYICSFVIHVCQCVSMCVYVLLSLIYVCSCVLMCAHVWSTFWKTRLNLYSILPTYTYIFVFIPSTAKKFDYIHLHILTLVFSSSTLPRVHFLIAFYLITITFFYFFFFNEIIHLSDMWKII